MVRVLKFGGTSVGDAACIGEVAALVTEALPSAPVVVLSAMSGATDALFRAGAAARAGKGAEALQEMGGLLERHRATARELFPGDVPGELLQALDVHAEELEQILRGVSLLRELSARSMDALASHGERLSTLLFVHLLRARHLEAHLLDARTLMLTDTTFGCAQPRMDLVRRACARHLAPLAKPGHVVVTQGYIGATEEGFTTTLGRGGSDWSAAIFGAALAAEEVQIWTDVEGVCTADPRRIPRAQPIAELSFAEAAELAAFGAKVLHPATIQPAVEARIPVTVRHTRRPRGRFTTIRAESPSGRPVTALASRGPVSVLTLTSTRMLAQSGYLARVFEVFGRLGVSVDVVATAEVSVSLTVEADAPLDALCNALSAFARVEVATGRAIVAMVGEHLKKTSGIAAKAFRALEDLNVEMISMGANEINLSLVVRQEQMGDALARLHAAFFEGA